VGLHAIKSALTEADKAESPMITALVYLAIELIVLGVIAWLLLYLVENVRSRSLSIASRAL
jgi:hypothetical protein